MFKYPIRSCSTDFNATNTSSTGLFGGTGGGGGGLFGATQQKTLFGTPSTSTTTTTASTGGFGGFGAANATTGGLFGATVQNKPVSSNLCEREKGLKYLVFTILSLEYTADYMVFHSDTTLFGLCNHIIMAEYLPVNTV